MITYRFPGCVVHVHDDVMRLVTVFEDGTDVPATPNYGDDPSERLAVWLGYGTDLWRMTVDHELGHSWLAYTHGLRWAPTLWRQAHGFPDGAIGHHHAGMEEHAVLEFQRKIDKAAVRPWEALRDP